MIRGCRGLFALVALWVMAARASASGEHFVVISNGEVVGSLQTTRQGNHLTVDYHVEDNGRGPRTKEEIDLGGERLPRRWSISGSGETGAENRETFEWSGTRARWRTLNDDGSVNTATHTRGLYVAQGASPYAYAIYLEALLKAPHNTLGGWPTGSVRAEPVVLPGVPGHAWALWGLQVAPVFVLEQGGRFRAWLSSDRLLIPGDWLKDAGRLARLAGALDKSLLHELTHELAHRWDGPVYLRNVHVFDPTTGTLSPVATVVTFRHRISAVLPGDAPLPAEAVGLDGEGGTVMAALFDMHAHVSPWQAPLYLAAGVTTVRDMGNDNAMLLDLMAELDSERIAGPSVVASGFLEGRSPFSARDGFVIDRLAAGVKAVRWYADHGYWQVKIYNSIDPEWVAPLAGEAHRLGLRVAGHVPAFMSSERAIRDGYDEITHLNQLILSLMIDPAKDDTRTPFRFTALGERTASLDLHGPAFSHLLRLMQDHGTVLDPTVAVLSEMLLARAGQVTPVDAPWIAHVPAPVQRGRKAAWLDIPAGQDALYRASEARLLEALKALHDAGIRLVPGTDDAPGFLLQSELETWQRAGIAPVEILKLATLGCARYLGLDQELGSVQRGKRADLIVVQGDPTHDVGVLRRIRLVMKAGTVFFPEQVHKAMQITPFAPGVPLVR